MEFCISIHYNIGLLMSMCGDIFLFMTRSHVIQGICCLVYRNNIFVIFIDAKYICDKVMYLFQNDKYFKP